MTAACSVTVVILDLVCAVVAIFLFQLWYSAEVGPSISDVHC